jgi:hypothetical protein
VICRWLGLAWQCSAPSERASGPVSSSWTPPPSSASPLIPSHHIHSLESTCHIDPHSTAWLGLIGKSHRAFCHPEITKITGNTGI